MIIFKTILLSSFIYQKGPICSTEMFACDEKRCISPELLCNGKIDCIDGSDEKDNCQGMAIGQNLVIIMDESKIFLES